MKLSHAQKRILQCFVRTGTATISDCEKTTRYWKPTLTWLSAYGYVCCSGLGYALTEKGRSVMNQLD